MVILDIKKKILGIFICTLLITTALPRMISTGSGKSFDSQVLSDNIDSQNNNNLFTRKDKSNDLSNIESSTNQMVDKQLTIEKQEIGYPVNYPYNPFPSRKGTRL